MDCTFRVRKTDVSYLCVYTFLVHGLGDFAIKGSEAQANVTHPDILHPCNTRVINYCNEKRLFSWVICMEIMHVFILLKKSILTE